MTGLLWTRLIWVKWGQKASEFLNVIILQIFIIIVVIIIIIDKSLYNSLRTNVML